MNTRLESRLGKLEMEINELKREIYSSRNKTRFGKAAGSWRTLDTEKLKKSIYSARKDTSRKVEF